MEQFAERSAALDARLTSLGDPVVIRRACDADLPRLHDLAELDSAKR